MRHNRENLWLEENTPPPAMMQSGTAVEAAEALIALQHERDPNQYSSDQTTQTGNVRSALTEKINIIENIKLN